MMVSTATAGAQTASAPADAVAGEAATPAEVERGSKSQIFTPGILIQAWLQGAKEAGETEASFRVRRAELKLTGEIVADTVGYTLAVDPARSRELVASEVPVDGAEGATVTVYQPSGERRPDPVTILQDAYVVFRTELADFSIGQFKIPLSLEGYGSSSKLLFPERALVSRVFGDRRDLGVRIEKELGDHFRYTAALFNGSGQNRMDDDTSKDAALRLEYYPLPGLTAAAAGYSTVGSRATSGRDRLELDLRLDRGGTVVIGEYIHGWDAQGGRAREGYGTYLGIGQTLFGRLQPIGRIGLFDPDLAQGGDRVRHTELGLVWLLEGQTKLTVAWGHASRTVKTQERTELLLAAQAAF